MSGLLAGKVWVSALAPHLKPLAATLADIADDDGTSIYPTFAYVAWRLGCSKRRVQRGIDTLATMGILQLVEPAAHYRSAEYRLIEDNLPQRARWAKPIGGRARAHGRHAVPHDVGPMGDTVSPIEFSKGDTANMPRVTPQTAKGDTASSARVTPRADSLPLSLNDPSLDPSIDPSRERESPAKAGPPPPEQLVAHWNAHRKPGPTVTQLTPERRRAYARALVATPHLDDWTVAIGWLNSQAFANAPGTGEHATWRARLDWLAKPGQLAQVLEQAGADAANPPRRPRRAGDGPTAGLTAAQRDAQHDRQQAQKTAFEEHDRRRDALAADAADRVLNLSDQARAVLERDVLAELEPYRDRLSTARFDDLVLASLPQQLITRAHDRPLADVVAELEGKVVAA